MKVGVDPNVHRTLPCIPLRVIRTNLKAAKIAIGVWWKDFFFVFVAKLKKSWSEILENDPLLYIVNIPLIWAIYGYLKADKIVNQLQRQGHYQISRENCKKKYERE